MPLLAATNVRKIYRMGSGLVPALDGVSIEIRHGEFLAIQGTSGSGKSTLLNLLAGLDRPSSGEIAFEGAPLSTLSAKEMSQYRLRKVGMVFQSFNLIPTMTATDNVALALAFAGVGRSERREKARALLENMGLGARTDHHPSELSGGEQQRVSIARALANDPPVLLADEPTGNLDSIRAHEVLQLLKTLQSRGKTIVLVTHDQELATAFSDRFIRLKDGKIQPSA